MRRIALSVALACLGTAMVSAAHSQTRGVVELFTSQGCSSCPPADRILGELARDPSIVAISLPIDYWDYLGWKDSLASPDNTARQRGYARRRGDREVYTPQVVVNGKVHVAGGDERAIEQAIAATRADHTTLSVPVNIQLAGGHLSVSIPTATNGRSGAAVWLCPMASNVPVTIERGENRGRTVIYHNVVRRWLRLGEWNGEARTFDVPTAGLTEDGVDAVAVLLQAGAVDYPKIMLGAAIRSIN